MSMIERTTRFKKELKRERKGRFWTAIDADLGAVIDGLANDGPLTE